MKNKTILSKASELLKKVSDDNSSFAFQGGTVLKKVYFEDYRFSEDLDFTLLDEKISNDKVFRQYSDLPEDSFTLQCYSLSEVIIEKMAALMGRTEPRDLYDFWYLTESKAWIQNTINLNLNERQKTRSITQINLKKKCSRKKTRRSNE